MRLKTLLYTLCLRRYRAVSFDIFDTLLERDVDRPVDVFLRVGDIVLGAGKGERFQADRIGSGSGTSCWAPEKASGSRRTASEPRKRRGPRRRTGK